MMLRFPRSLPSLPVALPSGLGRALLVGALVVGAPLVGAPLVTASAAPGAERPATKPEEGRPIRVKRERSRTGPKPGQLKAKQEREGGERATAPATVAVGNSFLRQGKYRAAASAFRRVLDEHPDASPASVGLGRALARLGRCSDALDELWPQVDSPAFNAEAALAAAACSARLGLADDALYFDRLGVGMNDENGRLLTQYVLDLDTAGLLAERDAALDLLLVANPDRDATAYARAVIALRRGDLDTLDEVIFQWDSDGTNRSERQRLLIQSWLDLDDPAEADRLVRGIRLGDRGVHVRQLRAEALRRLGQADAALAVLDSQVASRAQATDIDAIRARIHADLGRLDDARATLGEYDQTDDPDVLASFWYLAHREGDAPAMARYADAYAKVETSPLRTLAHLLPVDERAE